MGGRKFDAIENLRKGNGDVYLLTKQAFSTERKSTG
jgi:hypothetical protein